MTYSIVALDPGTGELGVGVQTRWLAVGAVVPWVEAGVGAVATQSFSEVAHGFNGLRLMRGGHGAGEALAAVLADDAGEAVRQVGMVDARGGSAAHTGLRCVRYASHLVRPGITVQANGRASPAVRGGRAPARRGGGAASPALRCGHKCDRPPGVGGGGGQPVAGVGGGSYSVVLQLSNARVLGDLPHTVRVQ